MKPADAYRELRTETRSIATLDSIGAVLGWDEQTYLPGAGTDLRAEQTALVAKLSHQQFTAPRIGDLIDAVAQSDLVRDPESDAAANVREWRRTYDRARKLPTDLVEEMTRTAVLSQAAWGEAKKASNFAKFEPWLDKTLSLKRREAECVGAPSGNLYDALLDAYEPGETTANVKRVFDSFRPALVELIHKIGQSKKKAPTEILERTYPKDLQDKLAREAAAAVGYDFSAGRLDVTIHPFCTGIGPGDTRITTRFDNSFGNAFFSVLHEVGHALYEQGLPKREHFGEPIAESISLGIHESQSRMWENLVGRSRAFWKFFWPKAQAAFGSVISDVCEDKWLFAVNEVRPSLIRTEADETTYNLHIMLRFEMEQALIGGELKAHDVPAAWNERMKRDFGIDVPDDRHGCLQDVHWSAGLQGYFPTYALGNIYAAQFYEKAKKDLGDLDAMFAKGEFRPLLDWLRTNIHRHGKRYTATQLLKRVTGEELDATALLKQLRDNASEFYGV